MKASRAIVETIGAASRLDKRSLVCPENGSFLPPHQRGIVLLSQRHGLPPHTTVLKAVALVAESSAAAREILQAAGLQELERTKVSALSGGQAAQVALARALAVRPRTLVLDEPFAALDVAAAQRWREFLRASAGDRTTVMVSHNPLEIASLAGAAVVLERGRTVTAGPVAEIFAIPPNEFVAQLAGVNRICGTVTATNKYTTTMQAGSQIIRGITHSAEVTVDAKALAVFDPQATSIRLPDSAAVQESTQNLWEGNIRAIESSGGVTEVLVDTCGTLVRIPITSASATRLGLAAADTIALATKATAITIYPAATS